MPSDPIARVPSAPAGVLRIAATQPTPLATPQATPQATSQSETGPGPTTRALVGVGLGLVLGAIAVVLTDRKR